jgi:Domain of unknown function (DUF4157)
MSFHGRRHGSSGSSPGAHAPLTSSALGKSTLVQSIQTVQRKATAKAGAAPGAEADVHAAAADGVSGTAGRLPYRDQIQASFGAHDVSHVKAHTDEAASRGAAAMGAQAFATGDRVAFDGAPDLHTAAHEAAHVVQQRAGVHLKGGVGAEGDAYERHADEVADLVVQGKSSEHVLSRFAGGGGGSAAGSSAVQRKVAINGVGEPQTVELLLERLTTHGVLAKARTIYQEVLRTKPETLAQNPQLTNLEIEQRHVQEELVRAWHDDNAQIYTYADNETASEKLLKDVFKFMLHSEHNWRSIGVAEYMTGDATGLALAPTVDPALTVKVLTGDQKKESKQGANDAVAGPTFLSNNHTQLPGYFQGAQDNGQVVLSDTGKKDYAGTSDRYNKHYNTHSGQPIKPWNKETYEATRVVGEALRDPDKQDVLRGQIQPGSSESDIEAKAKIAEFKQTKLDAKVGGKKCIFLWGRASGKKGGAHKELDSHAEMLAQLAARMRAEFADRLLVMVGDEVITKPELVQKGIPEDHLLYLGEFWNDPDYGKYMKDRNRQRHLFSLFDQENDAVSIGMRSGSLEGMALLGMRVIFIDDRGNNAAGRMEYWAGDAADGRAAAYANQDPVARSQYESDHAGPLPSYKRVATLQKLGDRIDARQALLTEAREVLTALRGVDATGAPISTDDGDEAGNQILDALVTQDVAKPILAGTMPSDPAQVQQFFDGLDRLIKAVRSSGYAGKAAVSKASSYRFHRPELERVIEALATLGEPGDGARAAVTAIRDQRDVTGASLAHDGETTKPAEGLLGNLLKNVKKSQPVSAKDAEDFLKRYSKQQGGLAGKQQDATGGSIKFRAATVQQLEGAVAFLEQRNALQPEELDQISSLTKQLAPGDAQ